MLPSPPTHRLLKTLKTQAWTRLLIRPWAPLLNRGRAGQLGLPCLRAKTRLGADLRTLSSLRFVNPPRVAAHISRTILPVCGLRPLHVPPESLLRWTPLRCVSRQSRRLKWSRLCGTANTSLQRTPSSLRLSERSIRRHYRTLGHDHRPAPLR